MIYDLLKTILSILVYHLICENKHAKPGQCFNLLPEVLYNRMAKGLLRHRLGLDNTPINA